MKTDQAGEVSSVFAKGQWQTSRPARIFSPGVLAEAIAPEAVRNRTAGTCRRIETIEALWEKVDTEWHEYGLRVAALTDDLRAKFIAVQAQALERAKPVGWNDADDLAADS